MFELEVHLDVFNKLHVLISLRGVAIAGGKSESSQNARATHPAAATASPAVRQAAEKRGEALKRCKKQSSSKLMQL